MNASANLELAITHLLRAKELAAFFQWPAEQQERIALLLRGAIDLQRKIRGASMAATA